MKDFYDILGVSEDADAQEIKKAYRKLSLKYHPDHNKEADAEVKMKDINEAYATLSDPDKRQIYDLGGDGAFDANQQVSDILRNMGFNINIDFGTGTATHVRNSANKIQIRHQVNISLHDAVFGCDIDTDIPFYIACGECNGTGGTRAQCHKCKGAGHTVTFLGAMQFPALCVTCNGKGYVLTTTCNGCNQEGVKKQVRRVKVKFSPGTQHQSAIHISPESGDKCDVFVVANVMRHPTISRNGATLFSTEPISCLDAMAGGVKKVEVIDGMCDLVIPPGTQQGQQLTIEGRGGILTNGRANHIVSVSIYVPKDLTPEQVEKIRAIRDNK